MAWFCSVFCFLSYDIPLCGLVLFLRDLQPLICWAYWICECIFQILKNFRHHFYKFSHAQSLCSPVTTSITHILDWLILFLKPFRLYSSFFWGPPCTVLCLNSFYIPGSILLISPVFKLVSSPSSESRCHFLCFCFF